MVRFLLLITLGVCCVSGCARFAKHENPKIIGPEEAALPLPPDYRIQPTDQLEIKFFYNPEMNEQLPVRPDGRIALPLIREEYIAGMTAKEVEEVLEKSYKNKLADPDLTVKVTSADSRVVFVDGEVVTPGMLTLPGELTVLQALANAGGLKETARESEVIVVRRKERKPQILRLNLADALDNDIPLQPYDVVFVPRRPINYINQWVAEYFLSYFPLRVHWNYDLTDYGAPPAVNVQYTPNEQQPSE